MTKNRFLGISLKDYGNYTKCRKYKNINLGMTKKPEKE